MGTARVLGLNLRVSGVLFDFGFQGLGVQDVRFRGFGMKGLGRIPGFKFVGFAQGVSFQGV